MLPSYALLRLDTEDFLTPAADEALLDLATLLTKKGVRATFPVVGLKLKSLVDSGRSDVLEALSYHDIGYHSHTHSLHPTISEELNGLPWGEGVRRFEARERPGFDLFVDVFGRPPACYTQPGANWVPHAMPVLRKWGIPCHYSDGWNAYVDLGGRPFWYQGVLNVSTEVSLPKPFLSQLPRCRREAARCVRRRLGAGVYQEDLRPAFGSPDDITAATLREPRLANLVTHPTELVTTRFWDALNFGRGRSPERNAWVAAPLRPSAEATAALGAFADFIDDVSRLSGLIWARIGRVAGEWADPAASRIFRRADLLRAAYALIDQAACDRDGNSGKLYYVDLGEGIYLAPVECLDLFVRAFLLEAAGHGSYALWLRSSGPFGDIDDAPGAADEGGKALAVDPSANEGEERRGAGGLELPSEVFQAGVRAIRKRGPLPAGGSIDFEGRSVSPASLLLTMADMYVCAVSNEIPELVTFRSASLRTDGFVKEPAELPWRWPVFPKGFEAPSILQAAKDQIWTLKPATWRGAG